ncbi:early nodulin-like protein 3 [Capsicum annuum]|uniref:early nodulin-like protein 3 n=1 Tax=Capsicum annuum TaxID=4072 RepID=UPI001FB19DDC|nr:early nodulin-like protein 3 [Capsicum annuum]
MAQMTGLRANRKVLCILGLFNILLMLQNVNCYEFKVGGSGDWSVPMDPNANNYNQWAERSRFQIGDTLSFHYSDKDSVLLVNKADFDNCNTASPIEKYSDGHSVFKFNHSGSYYFISGVHDNCVKNQKLHVVVMADRSHNTKTGASPPPPSVDDVPPAPAPAPAGEEAPSPPTSSVEIIPTPAPSQESSPPKNGASSIVMSFVGSTAAFVGSSILLGF